MGVRPRPPIPFAHRLTVRLTGGVVIALLLIGTPFFLAFQRLLRTQQIEALEEATTGLSRVVVEGLGSAMLAGHPHLLDDVVLGLAAREEVEKVLLLDHAGRVRVSSDAGLRGRVLDREKDATCGVCHRANEPAPRDRTAVVAEGGRRLLRAMSTIPNEPRCHGCHDPAVASNGILLMDLGLAAADRRFLAGIGSAVALGALMVVVTIAALVLLLQRMIHEPLRAVVSAGRRVVGGDLDARAAVRSRGDFALLASQVNDMTDHLADSLRTVERQRRELQEILDAVDDEVVVLDRDQRVVAANRAFRRGLRDADEDVAGRPCRDLTSHGSACAADQPGACPVREVFLTGRLGKGIVSRVGSDGAARTIEIHASPLRSPDGGVEMVVEVRRDISERRQMEATLANSERLSSLGLLASGISHEINNPLATIATTVEGLRRSLQEATGLPPETTTMLESRLHRIAEEVQRGRSITHRLLKVARPPGGGRGLVDVNHVVKDVVAVLAGDIRRSGVAAELDLGEGLPPLRGDPSGLNQVVMNLSLNAIQAMTGGGGTLRIATRAADGGVRLEVQDTGCGIPLEQMKRVFEPFFTTKPVGKGTGLGLFITDRLVAEMGGSVRIGSRPGEGTLVTVWVPAGGGAEAGT